MNYLLIPVAIYFTIGLIVATVMYQTDPYKRTDTAASVFVGFLVIMFGWPLVVFVLWASTRGILR